MEVALGGVYMYMMRVMCDREGEIEECGGACT